MNPLFKKLLAPRQMEYLAIDREFRILELSFGVKRFAESPKQVDVGQDVRLGFPELIGSESVLINVLEGQRANFQFKGISRSLDNSSPFYLDLFVVEHSDEETLEHKLIILFEDVTELMVLEQTLVQQSNEANLLLNRLVISKNYTEKVVGSITDALIVTTLSGSIQTVNQATQSIFGYSEMELLNQPISLLIRDELLLLQTRQLNLFAKGELFKDIEAVCQTKAGQEVIVAFSCSTVKTDRADLQSLVYIGRDITVRKQAEAQMYRALQKERELNELKSRFVSMTSHEFRTPLSVILLATRLLERFHHQATEEKRREYLQRIQSSAKHMSQLLEDILMIGQIEAGSLRLTPSSFDLVQFLRELMVELQATIDIQKRINFTSNQLQADVCMDQKLVRQITANLLSNALKYSGSQPVQFELIFQPGEVIFEVQDQGIGIPIAEQKQIFEPFYRAENVSSISGTGLGLSIVQKCVKVHHGNLSVTSEVGIGTKFRAVLPLNLLLQH
jgi:PAS domain S-box-containing protein